MNVVVPLGPATGASGLDVTVKSAGLVPSLVIASPVRSAVPVFLMVKERLVLEPTFTEPNAFAPASAMLVPAGCSTAISGVAAACTVSIELRSVTAPA